jgi:hypothetical protein
MRAALRETVAAIFEQGIPPAEAARLLRSIVGLRSDQAEAVRALRAEILASPGAKLWAGNVAIRVPVDVTTEWMERRVQAYADKLLADRGRLIARTETMRASNEGQRAEWRAARDAGELPDGTLRKWIVTPDDRLCPLCEAMDQETADLEEPFSDEDGTEIENPPLHPNCRCTTVLTFPRRAAARWLGDLPGHEFHGNQWTGKGAGSSGGSGSFKSIKDARFYDLDGDPTSREQFLETAASVLDLSREKTEALLGGTSDIMAEAVGGTDPVVSLRLSLEKFTVKLDVVHGSESAAHIQRVFERDGDVLRAEHEYFTLPLARQGEGVATKMLVDSVALYERMGVDEVRLQANLNVGGYAWGKLGFEQEGLAFYSALARKFRNSNMALTPARLAERAELLRLSAGPDGPSRVADHPAGKTAMLGTSWSAVMHFGTPAATEFKARLDKKLKEKKGA